MNDNIDFVKLAGHLRNNPLSELWAVTLYPDEFTFPYYYSLSYENRIDLFCIVLDWLLENEKMRLAKDGTFLTCPIKDQVVVFKKSFPETEKEMQEKDAYWWYLDDCPGGAVWYNSVEDEGGQTSPVGDGRYYFWT